MNPLVVVLPVSRPDFHLALKWLRWATQLDLRSPADTPRLVIFCARNISESEMDELLGLSFADAEIALCPENCEDSKLGYAYSANIMLRTALEYVEDEYPDSPMLWCEADCIPTNVNWAQEIADEYAAHGAEFMGDYHGEGEIPHMTGNAVYGPNWRTAAPSLAALPGPNPSQGWDSSCAHETTQHMHVARTIQQVWMCPRFTAENVDQIVRRETALFHRCKDGSLIDVLAERFGIPPIPLTPPLCAPTPHAKDPAKPEPLRTTILIVTYAKDMEFLRYCILSIQKFARGFHDVVLVVPEHERGLYDWVAGYVPSHVRYFHEPAGKGMLAHEVEICRADEHCPDADIILHMDSDVMFTKPVTPELFAPKGKPTITREHYGLCGPRNENRLFWRGAVERAIAITPEYDYMVKHCAVHLREVYPMLRRMVETHTGKPFNEYVLAGQNHFPQSFAEFPALGTVANAFFSERYSFLDYDHAGDRKKFGIGHDNFQYIYSPARDRVVEWWSHGGIELYCSRCEAILAGRTETFYLK